MVILLFTLIELACFSFLNPVSEAMQWAFVFVNLALVMASLSKYPSAIRNCFLIGLLLRVGLLIVDYYKILPVTHSGMDSEAFDAVASDNINALVISNARGNYTLFLTSLYQLLGHCRLVAQYINVLFGMGVLICIYSCLDSIKVNRKTTIRTMWIAALFPHLIIFSGILLREAWCEFFIILSLVFFLRWFKTGKMYFALVSTLPVLAATWMHSGCIGVLAGYAMAYALYDAKRNQFSFSGRAIGGGIIVLLLIGFVTAYSNLFLAKFGDFNPLDEGDMIEKINYSSGQSAYLTWLNANSLVLSYLFSPLKMFYFLFSPIPLDWRGVGDVIAFGMDGVGYFYFVYAIVRFLRSRVESSAKPLTKMLFTAVLLHTFIFALGTYNSGTAIRHRAKILPVLLIAYSISASASKSPKRTTHYHYHPTTY